MNQSHQQNSVPKLKVFIASSSVVKEERDEVVEVLKDLNVDVQLCEHMHLVAVRWDHRDAPTPMQATLNAQDSVILQIGKPSDCDFIVAVGKGNEGELLPVRGPGAGGTDETHRIEMGIRDPLIQLLNHLSRSRICDEQIDRKQVSF